MKKVNIRKMVISALLTAIIWLLGMVLTFLGYPSIPPFHATTIHIPVIIGAILEGPVVGLILGFMFGVTSLLQAIMNPTMLNFPFINPLVSILPRLLIPLAAYYSYKLFFKLTKRVGVSAAAGGVLGSVTSTVFVIGMILFLYAKEAAEALGVAANIIAGLLIADGALNCVAESVLAALITTAVVVAMKRTKNRPHIEPAAKKDGGNL